MTLELDAETRSDIDLKRRGVPEIWLPVPGFDGLYEASSFGRVRSLDRLAPRTNRRGTRFFAWQRGRLLSPGPHPGGYQTLHLYRDGERWATVLHIVIAETFYGPRPSPDYEVRHLSGDKADCSIFNLLWGTRAENAEDMLRHGTRLRGETSAVSKLSEADVIAIRRRIGEPQQDLADEFGCTFSNISAIQLRKSWRHV